MSDAGSTPPNEDGYTPTTTHAEWGAGNPHLHVSGPERFDFPLDSERTSIGAAEGSDLRLAGTAALHAEIVHDNEDEYVLVLHGPAETSGYETVRDSYDAVEGEVLRTGARFVLGPWSLVYARDEYADHGRPFGGRLGGEGEKQPVQPPRPDYDGDDQI